MIFLIRKLLYVNYLRRYTNEVVRLNDVIRVAELTIVESIINYILCYNTDY